MPTYLESYRGGAPADVMLAHADQEIETTTAERNAALADVARLTRELKGAREAQDFVTRWLRVLLLEVACPTCGAAPGKEHDGDCPISKFLVLLWLRDQARKSGGANGA